VIYQETGTGRRAESADAYLQLLQGWKQAFPDATGTIRNVVANGNTVVQELEWTGTQTGDMPTPAGVLPASGKRIVVLASLWYTFQGDTIQEVHHHLDIMTMMAQLGAIPAPG
jgi:predicted ester cyclase